MGDGPGSGDGSAAGTGIVENGHRGMTRLQQYLKHGHRVEGWLNAYTATFIAELSRIQRDAGMIGRVGEIGVHLGRLFILLKLTTAPGEKSFAVDVFDYLSGNRTACTIRRLFLENVAKWTGNRSVEIIQQSSLNVRPADILALVGPCRLVSIDGGHTAECAYNDLRLIDSVLTPMGVALLDDFHNPEWPAVAEGAARYFFDPTTLRPFAITPNKLYVANPAAHDFYRRALRASQSRWYDKTAEAFGGEIDLFGVFPHGLSARLKRGLKNRAQYLIQRGKRLRAIFARSAH